MQEANFVADSLLEGDGFEPSVPHKKQPFWLPPFGPAIRLPQRKTGSFVPGADGSNPSPSSGESGANLIFGGESGVCLFFASTTEIHLLFCYDRRR
jgi:hypothetical protein